MSDKLILFTLDGCGHCKTLKKELTDLSIPYTELEINTNRKIWDQVVSQTNLDYLPTFFIKREGTNNGPVFCPDRDFKTHEEAISIIKKYFVTENEG
jgi:glutaredoxin